MIMTASKKINGKIIAFVLLGLLIGLNACKKDYIDYAKLQQEEIDAREKYLADNFETVKLTEDGRTFTALIRDYGTVKDTVRPTSSGLYFYYEKPEDVGTGDKPILGRIVEVGYERKLLDGSVYKADTTEYYYPDRIEVLGMAEAISYMRVGGKAKLIVPSGLAYQQYEQSTKEGVIPRYSTLLFDIELINAQ